LAIATSILALMSVAREGLAADCPARPPEAVNARRSLAKEWFARAEAAEANGNDQLAVKAYRCSWKMVDHAFTAYNLAHAAERVGDPELALTAFRDYLERKRGTRDRWKVVEAIKSLETRLALAGAEASLPTVAAALPATPAGGAPAQAPPSAQVPLPLAVHDSSPAPAGRATREPVSTAVWIVAGGGAAALTAGVLFNVGARRSARQCVSLADERDRLAAVYSCDRAKQLAYVSYGLFAVAGAAAAVDLVLVFGRPRAVGGIALSLDLAGPAIAASGRF
jgi:hypothetical protein